VNNADLNVNSSETRPNHKDHNKNDINVIENLNNNININKNIN
jgi:hypothetical protein